MAGKFESSTESSTESLIEMEGQQGSCGKKRLDVGVGLGIDLEGEFGSGLEIDFDFATGFDPVVIDSGLEIVGFEPPIDTELHQRSATQGFRGSGIVVELVVDLVFDHRYDLGIGL